MVDHKRASRLVLNQVIPEYPPLAKVNYIQGKVLVELVVSRDGRVARAHVLQGHPILAASALRAVRRWLYRPLQTATGPSTFLTTVNMNFSLFSKKIEPLPHDAEDDLRRQVKPPEVLSLPAEHAWGSFVRLRVLLNDRGEVIDSQPIQGPAAEFEEARKTIEHWTFRPARWGTLALPWYLDVDVPVSSPAIHPAAADSGGQ